MPRPPASLQLIEFTDREFLYVLDDSTNGDGWATSQQVQATLQLDSDHATRMIGSRLGYLRKLGLVETDPTVPGHRRTMWRITHRGETYMHGDIPKALMQAIAAASEGEALTLVRQIRQIYETGGNDLAHVLDREWRHGVLRRRRWGG